MNGSNSFGRSGNRRHRIEDAAAFEFYQQPKQLYKDPYRECLNNNDRAIYMLIYNRFLLSVKNGMVDKEGFVFIYFDERSLAEETAVSAKTVKTCIRRLRESGLIDIVRQGCNKPNRIYVLKPEYVVDENNLHFQEEKKIPVDEAIFPLEVQELPTSNTSINTEEEYEFTQSNRSVCALEVDKIEEYVKDLMGYEIITEKEDIEVNCVLGDIVNILTYEIFAAPEGKLFNFGTAEYPDYKSCNIIKSVLTKNLNFAVVTAYINQFLLKAKPVKNGTMYHIKGLYRQCMTQSTQYLTKDGNLHRWENQSDKDTPQSEGVESPSGEDRNGSF